MIYQKKPYKDFIYEGNKTKEISFPVGGIGTGCIGIAGTGHFIDWEIFNKPNKGGLHGFSHFAVKAENKSSVLDSRTLHADLHPPYSGLLAGENFKCFGFGPDRSLLSGVPHFTTAKFQGTFPIADLEFSGSKFPGKVSLNAFNPFIPHDDKNSSIPAAFFIVTFENISAVPLTYTAALTIKNPHGSGIPSNRYLQDGNLHLIYFSSLEPKPGEIGHGDLCMATDAPAISYQEYWYRGNWFDNLGVYWRDFISFGRLKNRHYYDPPEKKDADHATLAAHVEIESGKKKSVRFVLTWNFPVCHNYWNPVCCSPNGKCTPEKQSTWLNYYATVFDNSIHSAKYALSNFDALLNRTEKFRDALFTSTLPAEIIDAISANLSVIKSPTCLRLEDGSLYGFEGCHTDSGCCEGSCTHVWNYAYAVPFLFPGLERTMIDLDFKYNQREDGSMLFRLQLPLGRHPGTSAGVIGSWSLRACVDGQFGDILKVYRYWKIMGDSEWLKKLWPQVVRAIDFAWAETNEDKWDLDKDGVIEGRQHHTLDMELFGPNSWLNGFYIAALKAGAEMARHLGDDVKAKEYQDLYIRGKDWTDANLFNGEYYAQKVDINERSVLTGYENTATLIGSSMEKAYWDSEHGELKYQIGEGCEIDQVIAQWHANISGLGNIFNRNQRVSALRSVYKYNFKLNMRDFFNPCNIKSLNDESGLIICEWPSGKDKPFFPLTYAEETMNGYEYQAAIHMIQEGLVKEGLNVVRSIRNRYDGEKRNPWNEFECGSNYARSMASYALLLAFSGFTFNMVDGSIGFNPINIDHDATYQVLWSVAHAWGTFSIEKNSIELQVIEGELAIRRVNLPFVDPKKITGISLNDKPVLYQSKTDAIEFIITIEMKCLDKLSLKRN